MPDWEETKTAELLAAGHRSGYFADMIQDAEEFERKGYVWVVALAKSAAYWAADPWGNLPGHSKKLSGLYPNRG